MKNFSNSITRFFTFLSPQWIIQTVVCFVFIAGTTAAWGQISLTGGTYTEDFDSYNGQSGGEPSGWSVSCPNYRGKGTGTSNSGGAWAYGTGSDYSMGYLGSGSSSSYTATVTFTNNTGATITDLIISYNFEQWRFVSGNNIGFTVSGTNGLSSKNLSALSQTTTSSGSTGTVSTTPKSITLTGLNIAVGATFGVKFTSSDGSGSDNGKSIDDFSLCIPPVINSQSTLTQTVCEGDTFAPLTVSATGSGLTYQWYSNTTTSNTGGISMGAANGAQTDSFTPPSTTVGQLYYYAEVSNGTCGASSAVSDAITVAAAPAINAQLTTAQTVCEGVAFNPLIVSATGSGLTYQWYSNTTASNTGGNNLGTANGAQTDSLTPPSNIADTSFFYVEVSNGTCTATSSVSDSIIVNGLPVINAQSTTTQTVCKGVAFTPLTVSASGAGLSYQWYSNTTASTTGGTSLGTANGAQTDSLTPPSDTAGIFFYYVEVSGTCSPMAVSTISDSIVVNGLPMVDSQATATQTVCKGVAFSPISVSASGAGLSYQWYSNTTASTTGGTSLGTANGAQTDTYTPQSTTVDSLYYYVEVSGTCSPMAVSAVSGQMIVNALPAITTQPATTNQTVCKGVSLTPLSVTATGLGLTYQWYSNTTASTTGGTSLGTANGAQTDTYTPQSTTEGTLYYYVEVSGTCSPMAVSTISGDVVVNAAPAITAQPATTAQTVIIGATVTPLTVAATGTGLSYQWYSNTTASTTGGTSLGTANGAQTNTYTPQNSATGTTYYYVVVSGTCSPAVTSKVSGAVTIKSPVTISISNSTFSQLVNQSLNRNKTIVPISRFLIEVANDVATINSVSFVTPGGDVSCNYVNTDITNFKLYYTTSSMLSSPKLVSGSSTQVSTKTVGASPETVTFSGLTQNFAPGTYYIWITAEVLPTAVIGHTVRVNPPVLTASVGTVSGNALATGVHTITAGVGIEDIAKANSVYVGSYGNEVKIIAQDDEQLTVEITDLLGRKQVATQIEGNAKVNTITLNGVATGYYLVKVSGNTTLYTAKVFIQ